MTELFTPWNKTLIVICGCLLLLLTSGVVVRSVLGRVGGRAGEPGIMEKIGKEARDTGFIIGKCENLLIFLFVLLNEFTALALLFAAKAIVRREDMSKNSLYFLAGSMVNVTYSIVVAVAVKAIAEQI